MHKIGFKNVYTTSSIPADDLKDAGFLEEDNDVFPVYRVEARQNPIGTWNIYRIPPHGDDQLAAEGLDWQGALTSLIFIEDYVIDGDFGLIDITCFTPENFDERPEENEIKKLEYYVESKNLPENHILRFALQFGKDKFEVDTICSKSNVSVATKTGARGTTFHMN